MKLKGKGYLGPAKRPYKGRIGKPKPKPWYGGARGSMGGPAPAAPAAQPGGGSAAAASTTSPLPWDAQYETQSGLLNRDYSNQIAQYGQQENETRSSYGFDPQFASNPLTRANLLQRNYDQSRTGAVNSMASRGQLYSGATSNALGYADFAHNKSYNDLQTSYRDDMNKITQGRIGARQSLDEGIASAKADALSRALGQDPEAITPGSDASGDGSGGGGGGAGAKGKGARKSVKSAAKKGKLKGYGKIGPMKPHKGRIGSAYTPPKKKGKK